MKAGTYTLLNEQQKEVLANLEMKGKMFLSPKSVSAIVDAFDMQQVTYEELMKLRNGFILYYREVFESMDEDADILAVSLQLSAASSVFDSYLYEKKIGGVL